MASVMFRAPPDADTKQCQAAAAQALKDVMQVSSFPPSAVTVLADGKPLVWGKHTRAHAISLRAVPHIRRLLFFDDTPYNMVEVDLPCRFSCIGTIHVRAPSAS